MNIDKNQREKIHSLPYTMNDLDRISKYIDTLMEIIDMAYLTEEQTINLEVAMQPLWDIQGQIMEEQNISICEKCSQFYVKIPKDEHKCNKCTMENS